MQRAAPGLRPSAAKSSPTLTTPLMPFVKEASGCTMSSARLRAKALNSCIEVRHSPPAMGTLVACRARGPRTTTRGGRLQPSF